jgi:hypothetical protein
VGTFLSCESLKNTNKTQRGAGIEHGGNNGGILGNNLGKGARGNGISWRSCWRSSRRLSVTKWTNKLGKLMAIQEQ